MRERTKQKLNTYVIGGIGGAIIVMVGGFWIGPLTTNGALRTAVEAAIVEQQAVFCAQRGQADPNYVGATAYGALNFRQQREFVDRHAEFDGQTSRIRRNVLNACSNLLGAT